MFPPLIPGVGYLQVQDPPQTQAAPRPRQHPRPTSDAIDPQHHTPQTAEQHPAQRSAPRQLDRRDQCSRSRTHTVTLSASRPPSNAKTSPHSGLSDDDTVFVVCVADASLLRCSTAYGSLVPSLSAAVRLRASSTCTLTVTDAGDAPASPDDAASDSCAGAGAGSDSGSASGAGSDRDGADTGPGDGAASTIAGIVSDNALGRRAIL